LNLRSQTIIILHGIRWIGSAVIQVILLIASYLSSRDGRIIRRIAGHSRRNLETHSPVVGLAIIAAAGVHLGDGGFVGQDLIRGAVELLLEDRLRIDGLELGAKIGQTLGAAVGAAPGIGEGVAIVLDFISGAAPDGL
jgi:hypothetical protein